MDKDHSDILPRFPDLDGRLGRIASARGMNRSGIAPAMQPLKPLAPYVSPILSGPFPATANPTR